MRRTSIRPDPRPGFTLVELLVVMTIIAILFALTSAAVVKAMVKMDESRTRNDISQLQGAVQAFKTDFGVAYIPSQITLPPAQPNPPVAGFDNTGESLQYITSLWPRINQAALGTSPQAFTFWNITGNQPVTLTGDQCLVFFLGGAFLGGSPVGFSTSPVNPMDTTGNTGASTRKGPYFQFPPMTGSSTDRLKPLYGNSFPSFIDIYGTQPYLYFSARKSGNDYVLPKTGLKPFVTFIEYSNSSRTSVVSARFANPNGFQIIAAGRDGVFGPGLDSWPGATIKIDSPPSSSSGATDMNGYDDVCNFHPTLLGIPAQ